MPTPPRKPILLVSRGLDPVGTGRQVELVAAGLQAAGWDVHLAATTGGGSLPDRLAAAGCTVHRVGQRPTVDPAAVARLVAVVGRLRPAVVSAWGRGQIPLAAATRLMAVRPRLVGWLARSGGGRWLATALRRLDAVVTASPGAAAAVARLGVGPPTVVQIPPAARVDPERRASRAEIGRRLGLDPARQWTLCVAPLEAASRLERLVWAIDQLGVVRRDLEHVLVGAGPLARRLLRRARAQHVADRLWLVPDCDLLPDLLPEAALVWQPGTVALGGAVLDAMAHGVPAVAVESDAARQLIVDGTTGWITPAVPESEFPRRAFALLENPDLAARSGAAAAARAASCFSASVSVADQVALHERLAG